MKKKFRLSAIKKVLTTEDIKKGYRDITQFDADLFAEWYSKPESKISFWYEDNFGDVYCNIRVEKISVTPEGKLIAVLNTHHKFKNMGNGYSQWVKM